MTPETQSQDKARIAKLNTLRSFCQRETWNQSSVTRSGWQDIGNTESPQEALLVEQQKQSFVTATALFNALHQEDLRLVQHLRRAPTAEESKNCISQEMIVAGYRERFEQDFGRAPNEQENAKLVAMAKQAWTIFIPIRIGVDEVLRSHNRHAMRDDIPTVADLVSKLPKKEP